MIQIGNQNAFGISQKDKMDVSFSTDQQTDLPVDGKRKRGQFPGKFMADDLFGPDAPAIELFYRCNDGGAKTGCIAVYSVDGGSSLSLK